MKNLAIITLIGLIGLTCFVTTDVYSYWVSDMDAGMSQHPLMTFVYGYTWVRCSYEFPNATSSHMAAVYNDSGCNKLPDWPGPIAVKCYVTFTSEIFGNFREPFDSDRSWSTEQWVDGGDTWGTGKKFEYDLSKQRWQEIRINASSNLTVKVNLDGGNAWDAQDTWNASFFGEKFLHKEEALGIEDWNWDGED